MSVLRSVSALQMYQRATRGPIDGMAVVRFLLEYGAFAPWLSAWRSSVVLPMAVRIRLKRGAGEVSDTLLFPTRERG